MGHTCTMPKVTYIQLVHSLSLSLTLSVSLSLSLSLLCSSLPRTPGYVIEEQVLINSSSRMFQVRSSCQWPEAFLLN